MKSENIKIYRKSLSFPFIKTINLKQESRNLETHKILGQMECSLGEIAHQQAEVFY